MWYFRQSFVRTSSTRNVLREDWRSRLSQGERMRGLGSRWRYLRRCTQFKPALFSHPLLLLTVDGWAIPGIKGPEWEHRGHPWEQALWIICSHWQIYLFCLHLCYQGPGRNFFPNVVWHVPVSLVLGNDAAFWSDWDCEYTLPKLLTGWSIYLPKNCYSL